MQIPDLVNGIFEFSGGFFISASILQLYRDKVVKGVSWTHVAFFSSWGFWNLYFYPHLGQWLSFVGGALLVAANTFWLGQIVYYSWRNARAEKAAVAKGDDFWWRTEPSIETPFEEVIWRKTPMEADQFGGFDRPLDGKRYRHRDK